MEYRWDPAPLEEIAELFRSFGRPWWIAGGFAIELAVGRAYREHSDIDVALLRRDHVAVREHLAAWDCHAADPPGQLRPWVLGEELPAHVHDIWVRARSAAPWRFQLMLDEADGDTWIFRRNARVRLPFSALTVPGASPPRISPEVQLLYKAGSLRPKDQRDFDEVRPLLTPPQRDWLARALAVEHPAGHPWQERLAQAGAQP